VAAAHHDGYHLLYPRVYPTKALADPPPDLGLALLGDRPGTLLIGVDSSSDEVLVLKV
jgi:hypothetical protein